MSKQLMFSSKQISHFLRAVITFLKNIDERFTRNAYNPNPQELEDLTPSHDADPENIYSDLLAWALRNPESKNIALTGPYGSGKSSIIKTFEKRYKEFKFLNISLASFDEDIENSPEDRKRIEISILQQIFYKVQSGKVPFSRFRRIRNIPQWKFLLSAIFLLIWAVAFTFIFKPGFFERISWWAEFSKDTKNTDPLLYLSFGVFIGGTMFILVRLFRAYSTAKFQKLNVANGEIELAQDADASILNKHLDEIIYFFQRSKFDVLVIEDLDRFKDPEIFTKLRELNTLINSSCELHHKVTFIYALKDDIFIDSNRTKFFDFLLPVIPIISPSNSGEIFYRKFVKAQMDQDISQVFISDITLFINDMRMLKNIYNEYVLYKRKIGLDLNPEKLLAIIVYKNFFPSDFAELNRNQGLIQRTFNHKRVAAEELIKSYSQRIQELSAEITVISNTIPNNEFELRAVYVMALAAKAPTAFYFRVAGTDYPVNRLTEPEIFENLRKETDIIITSGGGYSSATRSKVNFKSIELLTDPNSTFDNRMRVMNQKLSSQLQILQKEKESLQSEIEQIRGWTLKTMIAKSPSSLLADAGKSKLLSYMVRRGFIDEMYPSYISHFYEGIITRQDMDFVISIKNNIPLPFNFKLEKNDQVIKRLELEDFTQKEMLNLSMIDYIAEHSTLYSSQFINVISLIGNQSVLSVKFLDEYLSVGNSIPKVFSKVCLQWPSIWNFIQNDIEHNEESKHIYLRAIIQFAGISTIPKLNVNNCLTDYLSSMSDYLLLFPVDQAIERQKTVLPLLTVIFKRLNYHEEYHKLFDFVYENSFYELNLDMIQLVLNVYAPSGHDLSQYSFANYATIVESGCTPLIEYIHSNIEYYIENIFLALPDNTQEKHEHLVDLFGREDIEDDVKELIISRQLANYSLPDLPPALWDYAINEDRILGHWDNVYYYWDSSEKDDDVLTTYLENQSVELSRTQILDLSFTVEDDLTSLRSFIALNNDLSDESYELLMQRGVRAWNSLNFESLDRSKVGILLRANRFNFTKKNYDILKANFDGLNITLLGNKISDYLKSEEEFIFDSADLKLIFESTTILPKVKLEILKKVDPEIINHKDLGSIIIPVVLNAATEKIGIEFLLPLIKHSGSFDYDVRLINLYLAGLTKQEIVDLLNTAGGEYGKINSKSGSLAKITNNENNRTLLASLINLSMISSFKPSKGKLIVYRKQK